MPPILPVGTQVVSLIDIRHVGGKRIHPAGAVGAVVKSPAGLEQPYLVRMADGYETRLLSADLTPLATFQSRGIEQPVVDRDDLFEHVIYQAIVGSRAYGLASEGSDVDRRGFYLPPAERQWSLAGAPEQIDCDATQESYWEVQKFLVLALKANPNVLECLYSPLVEKASPIARRLLDIRQLFLTRMIYQTFNGYAMSQFKKMNASLHNHDTIKPKHAMHLIRLLLAGIDTLRTGTLVLDAGRHRDDLLAIRDGAMPWEQVDRWRRRLHAEFETAHAETTLPDRPDYEAANAFLIDARREAVGMA